MKCVNTDWDQELINRLKRGRRSAGGDKSIGREDRSGSSPSSPLSEKPKNVGLWTMEQKLAKKAAREAEKRPAITHSAPIGSQRGSLTESPFWKIRMDLLESRTKDAAKPWDTSGFRKKMKILDDRAGEMKQVLTQERRPHQKLPPVKTMTELPSDLPTREVLPVAGPKLAAVNVDDVISKRNTPKEPKNYIDFSSLSLNIWSEICKLAQGENIPILMKSMKTQHWEKIIKYYGIFERAGRIDRGVLYELANDLGERFLEHPPYKELIKNLDPDPNKALFLLGKIMMSIFHNIVAQSGVCGSRHMSIQDITAKLDSGYKTVMKTKKEEDLRMSMRGNIKTKS